MPRLPLLAFTLLAFAACQAPAPYRCAQDADCVQGGVQGACGGDRICVFDAPIDGATDGPDDVDALIDGAAPVSPRNVCLEGAAMPANLDRCVTTVCEAIPACCSLGWDRTCIQLAERLNVGVDRPCDRSCSSMAVFPTGIGVQGVPSDGAAATVPLLDVRATEVNFAAVADHDGDGDGDLAYVTQTAWSVRTRSPAGLVEVGGQSGVTGFVGKHVAWADYDDDDDLDVLITGQMPSAMLILNDRGTFVAQPPLVQGDDISQADWGDIDGDGNLDIVTGDDFNGRRLKILRNDRDKGFMTITLAAPTFIGASGVRLCQLAGSPLPELVTAGPLFVRIYANDGGGFPTTPLLAVDDDGYRTETHCADLDNDGDLDVVVGAWAFQPLQIYRNDNGTFSTTATTLPAMVASSLDIGDIDGDGKLDLAIAPENEMPRWLRNTTTGPSASAITFALPIGLADPGTPHRGMDLAPRP